VSHEIVCVGFKCPVCGMRIAVLRSCDPTPSNTDAISSKCRCGFARLIPLAEIQSLDVWREEAA
jgi:hypothetical protein